MDGSAQQCAKNSERRLKSLDLDEVFSRENSSTSIKGHRDWKRTCSLLQLRSNFRVRNQQFKRKADYAVCDFLEEKKPALRSELETMASCSNSVQPSRHGDHVVKNRLPDCERLLRSLKSSSPNLSSSPNNIYCCHDASNKSEGCHRCESNTEPSSSKTSAISWPISPEEDIDEEEYIGDDEEVYAFNDSVAEWVNQFKNMSTAVQLDALSTLLDECSLAHIRHLQAVIEPFFQRDFIRDLPKEIALHVMSFLSPSDIACVSLTCRYWRNLAEDNQLWREKCKELDGPILDPPSDRKSGAWAETACTSGIEVIGYRPVVNDPYSLSHVYHRLHTHGYADLELRTTKTLDGTRSKWKATFLRHQRIQANWRSRPLTGSCILRGHDEHVITCLQLHGDLIVTGSDDNTLKVWSASKAICLHTLTGHTGGVWSSQMSECGSFIVSGSTDRTVRVWDVATGRCLHNLQGHTSTVRCMALKGKILVSGSRDTTIRVWDISTGCHLRTLHGHVAAVRCVQFDGKRIVSGAYDFSIKVWDMEAGTCIYTLTGHTNRVYSLLFDSERDIVVSGSLDTTIRVWNIRTGECVQALIGHQSLTSGMQLRGNTLVSGNADSTIKVWDIRDGQCKYTLSGPNGHSSAVTSLQFLENGLVATSSDDGSVKLWDAKRGAFIRDLVRLHSGGSGGCIWRLKSTPTMLICAVGSRNGTEDTKLILLNFDSDFPDLPHIIS